MADTVGMADIRGENISRAVKGFALMEYKMKQVLLNQSSSKWTETYYRETAAELTATGGGGGEFTEASAKIAYLAFQQTIEEEQLFIEESVLTQLNLVIELDFPVSLENELLSDQKKDGDQKESKPIETTAGKGQ